MMRVLSSFVLLLLTATATAQDAGVATARLARAQQLFVEGVQAYDAGELDEALTKLREAYSISPSGELALNLGRVYERMGDTDNALRLYRAVLARRGLAQVFRDEAAERIRATEEVARRMREQLYTAPPTSDELTSEARTFFVRGVTLFQRQRYDAALQAFMAAYQFARRPEVMFNIARTSERLHRTQDAIDYYNEYLRSSADEERRAFAEQKLRELRAR